MRSVGYAARCTFADEAGSHHALHGTLEAPLVQRLQSAKRSAFGECMLNRGEHLKELFTLMKFC
jgi:hypothetical protein